MVCPSVVTALHQPAKYNRLQMVSDGSKDSAATCAIVNEKALLLYLRDALLIVTSSRAVFPNILYSCTTVL